MDYTPPDRAYIDAHRLIYGEIGERAATGAILFRDKLMRPGFKLAPIRFAAVAPYGKCLGQTSASPIFGFAPEIGPGIWVFLQPSLYSRRHPQIVDPADTIDETVLHEMLHVELLQFDEDASHKGEPWARRCQELSDRLGLAVRIERPRSIRVDGRVTTGTPAGCMPYAELAVWPGQLLWGGPRLRIRLNSI